MARACPRIVRTSHGCLWFRGRATPISAAPSEPEDNHGDHYENYKDQSRDEQYTRSRLLMPYDHRQHPGGPSLFRAVRTSSGRPRPGVLGHTSARSLATERGV